MNEETAANVASLSGAPAGVIENVVSLLQAGGPVVALLLAMSVLALAIVLMKVWQFRSAQVWDRRTARDALRAWHSGSSVDAITAARRSRNPAAQVVAHAMTGIHRRLPEDKVREDAIRFGSDLLEDLRGWLRPLEVIASLAPLLGLFGTVIGMIEAFQQLEAAGNQVNPAILSGGIWVALLTTAVGLAVAIPAVALLSWLERRIDRIAHDMDSAVMRLFSGQPVTAEERQSHAPGSRHATAGSPAE